MADDWEADDWEREDFKPVLPGAKAAVSAATVVPGAAADYETAGQAILAAAAEPDMSKFQDEEQQEEEEEQSYHIKPQPKKKVDKKYANKGGDYDDTPLDDPVAERLRKQRLEEEADMRAGVFGAEGAASASKLAAMIPKSVKDFEEYADLLHQNFFLPHVANKNYKAFLKLLLKLSTDSLTSEETKEIENAVGTIRADKVKAEKAEAAKKKGAKRNVNVGKGGGTAGLDDYIYDAAEDDDFDFM